MLQSPHSKKNKLAYHIMYNEDWSHVRCKYYFSFTWVDKWLKSGHPNSADVLEEQSHLTLTGRAADHSPKADLGNQNPWDYYKFCPRVSG